MNKLHKKRSHIVLENDQSATIKVNKYIKPPSDYELYVQDDAL